VDTRTKIQSPEEAAAAAAAARRRGETVRLIAGSFDVLQAAHARDLQSHPASALFVAVRKGSEAVLTLRARAELVAAFRAVRCIIPVDRDLDAVIDAVRPDEFLDRTADHEAQLRRLIEHVHQRQSR
jgi:bifunctional ADP-heptose synthase (sugar kinase/adenylyltransferase)